MMEKGNGESVPSKGRGKKKKKTGQKQRQGVT